MADRIEFRVNSYNDNVQFARKIHVMINDFEMTLINIDGKLEIIGEKSLKITMSGGTNTVRVSEDT